MNIWLVSPAWQRYEITRLVLLERQWLIDVLAARGLTANTVIVADDENLDIAEELGFATVEKDNSDLGERFNAGYRYAAEQGADVFVHIGSDDWVHPDAFDILTRVDLEDTPSQEPEEDGGVAIWSPAPQLLAHRTLTLIDVARGVAQRCATENRYGCIPWLIPRSLMAAKRFSPITSGRMRGIDGALAIGLGHNLNWCFQDSPAEWCVDFKTNWNVSPYNGIARALGTEPERAAEPLLAAFYPADLVQQAMRLTT